MITKEQIKEAGISRLDLAHKLGLNYPSLTNRICGYCNWAPGEEERALEILEESKNHVGAK